MNRSETRSKEPATWSVWLRVIFGAIVLSFAAATAFAQWRLARLDQAAVDIADNAAPSIERLTTARQEMRQLQLHLRVYLDRRAAGLPASDQEIEAASGAMDQAIAEYLRLPVFPGEQEWWANILQAKATLHDATARCLALADRGEIRAAEDLASGDVSKAADDLSVAITNDVAFNADHSRDLAMQIKALRRGSMWTSMGLFVVCALVTLVAGVLLHRAIRAHTNLAGRHRRLLEERASELELFAGRIAHDILSPLSAVGFALQLGYGPADEQARAQLLARGTRALGRVQRLVQGLLEFARAGARPDPSGCTRVGRIITDLAKDLKMDAAEVGIELTVEINASPVACNEGVLTSLIANLARNAIKYMGDSPIRRIEIRAFDCDDSVRVEVADTGPGLSPCLEEHVFEPYVRGAHVKQSGLGLGLATVKRLVEAHRGTVGVRSVPGEGSTFWFELPKAIGEATESIEAPEARRPVHGASNVEVSHT